MCIYLFLVVYFIFSVIESTSCVCVHPIWCEIIIIMYYIIIIIIIFVCILVIGRCIFMCRRNEDIYRLNITSYP